MTCYRHCLLPLFSLSFLVAQKGICSSAKTSNTPFQVSADFVYLQRYHVDDQSIAVDTDQTSCEDGCYSNSVLDTKDLIDGFMPGCKLGISISPTEKSSYAADFLYLWEMDNTEKRYPKGILSVPFRRSSFAQDYKEVDSILANYKSQFYTGEVNYWYTFSNGRYSYFVLAGLFGLRFANISETFLLEVEKGDDQSDYEIKAKNDLLGIQIGFDFRIQPNHYFYWDLTAKAGADLNRIDAKVFLGDENNSVALRNYNRQETQSGIFAELSAGVGYSPLDWMTIRAGYQMLYFGGLALAPDQVSFSANQIHSSVINGPYPVQDNGYIILYGIYTGVTFSF